MNPAIRQQIREILGSEWEPFAARHPNLARVMDQEAIVEEIQSRLADDPDYQRAMDNAQLAGAAASELTILLRGFIKDWLARLF